MSLLGRNLESLLRKCGGFFTVNTILRVAIQVLTRIESLHAQRFIHRDIKPDNFVLGLGSSVNVVHLIDFGLSKYYQNSKGEHIPPNKKAGLIGTARYASVNAHNERRS
jgi:casein kinase I homolog HRR25